MHFPSGSAAVANPAQSTERILTSGCGGGITFRIDHRLFPRLASTLRVRPETLSLRMKDLFAAAVHYKTSRGIHGAALTDGERLLVVAEDVGRHNAVDKVVGYALLNGMLPLGAALMAVSGRLSFEIVQKAAAAGVPILAAVSAPSSLAVELAEEVGITLVGFLRNGTFNLYCHPDRIVA